MRILLSFFLCLALGAFAQEPCRVSAGDRIAFLGDSITNYGNYYPSGYVKLLKAAMDVNHIPCTFIPRGVGGNKSPQMLARLQRDILSQHPHRMLLSCGVNDVWHGPRGVNLKDYKTNMRAIVEQATAAGVIVDIMTASMIGEDPTLPNNQKLAGYNQFLRELAAEKKLLLIDINQAMQTEVSRLRQKYPKAHKQILTLDNVHMNALGNRMMAKTIMKAWNMPPAMITKAEAIWDQMIWPVNGFGLSTAEYLNLSEKAFSAGMEVSDYIKTKILGFSN